LRRSALPAFLPGNSPSWHFRPGEQAFHCDRRTGPYRFSRNPIYLAFILLVLGLSVWLNNLWLLVTLVPAFGLMAAVVIPREERFLERNFNDQYSSYKAQVRSWL
jgi:protein-S-isoprenylcysteine O-methyltransferase Ste14